MAGVFNGGHLHAQANAQVRNALFAGKAGGANFAFNAAFAKTAGHQDRVELTQARSVFGVQGFGVDVFDFDPRVVDQTGVAQGFVERFVAV